jgi:hypothetical protein
MSDIFGYVMGMGLFKDIWILILIIRFDEMSFLMMIDLFLKKLNDFL